jgi:hypothetical protein
MSRCTLRYLFTVVLYAGVAFVLIPYVTGQTSRALKYVLVGIGVSLVAGFARCYFMDGDCSDRLPDLPQTSSAPIARPK